MSASLAWHGYKDHFKSIFDYWWVLWIIQYSMLFEWWVSIFTYIDHIQWDFWVVSVCPSNTQNLGAFVWKIWQLNAKHSLEGIRSFGHQPNTFVQSSQCKGEFLAECFLLQMDITITYVELVLLATKLPVAPYFCPRQSQNSWIIEFQSNGIIKLHNHDHIPIHFYITYRNAIFQHQILHTYNKKTNVHSLLP